MWRPTPVFADARPGGNLLRDRPRRAHESRGSSIEREKTIELSLSPDPGSVARARTFLSDTLRRWSVPEETELVARLALSELVTNAVVHACTELVVRIRPESDAIWVGVSDQSRDLPVARPPEPGTVGGRGLVDRRRGGPALGGGPPVQPPGQDRLVHGPAARPH